MMNRNTIFVLVFIVLLLGIGYTWYGYLQTTVDTQVPQVEFTKVLAEVRRLKNLEIDTALFQERFFRELTAFQQTPQPEVTVGRENPFAPFR